MIPKLICWLFGHIWKTKIFEIPEHKDDIRLFHWEYLDRCRRCGKKI